jgi:phage gp29-like protein
MRTPELQREIATTADGIDITRGYTGPLLTPYDSVLRARGGNDFVIYEQVLSDPEVKATFGQRQLAVTRCEWQVDAGGTKRIDKQAAEYVREQLGQRVAWDNITTKMLYGVFFGFAVAEVIYRRDGARVGLEAIKVRNRRRFRYAKDGGLRLLTMHSMTEGVPCERPYFWDFQVGADHDDEPYGQGLAHWLYWPVLFKRNGIKFWLTFLEKFGSPTAVGTYDRDATTEERSRLLAACRAVQTDAGIILPKGMEITLLEAARSGTSDYKTLHDTMDATIQKVVLGQTASTQGTAGKLGNDDLQGDVRDDIIKADADLVCESFNNGPARWLTEWNFPGAAIPRVYRVTEKAEDLSARAKRDKDLKDIGYRPKLATVEEVYGQGYEAVSVPAPVPVVAPDDPAAAFAAPAPRPPDREDQLTALLARQAQPMVDGWVERVEQLVQSAGSLEAIRDGLQAIAPQLGTAEFAQVMAGAMSVAYVAGVGDAAEDSEQE